MPPGKDQHTMPEQTTTRTTQEAPRKGYWQRLPILVHPLTLAALWAVVIVYGSLVPFDLDTTQAIQDAGGFTKAALNALASPRRVVVQGESSLGISASLSDLLTNLALYVPLAVTLRLALRRRGWPWAIQIILVAMFVGAMSWAMESLQSLSPSRVPSLNDVVSNTAAAVLAAVFAPFSWQCGKRLIFWLYCKTAVLRYDAWQGLGRIKRQPVTMFGLVLVNAALLTAWYLSRVSEAHAAGSTGTAIAVPFESHFGRSYDVAAVLLGRSLIVYAALGCMLSVTMMRRAVRGRVFMVVLGVGLLSLIAEAYKAVTHNARPDITEPLIAVGAAILMGVTLYFFAHAVRCANRRHLQVPFEGGNRRRRPYAYGEQHGEKITCPVDGQRDEDG